MAKRKFIIIPLMLTILMLVQVTATSIASGNFENSFQNNTDSEKTSEINKLTKSNSDSVVNDGLTKPNGQTKQSAVTESYNKTFNDETNIWINSSFVQPGNALNIKVNSSAWSNYHYNNAYNFTLQSPDGDLPINQTNLLSLTNFTQTSGNLVDNWEGQTLNTAYSHNATSSGVKSDFFATSIQNVVDTSYYPTLQIITWETTGNVTSIVKYGTDNSSFDFSKEINSYVTDHTVYLKNLDQNTTYYYQIFGEDIFGDEINGSINSFTTATKNAGDPLIQNITISSITNDNVVVTLQTDIDSNATLWYSDNKGTLATLGGAGSTVTSPAKNSKDHSFSLNTGSLQILPGKEYFFYVRATNGANEFYNNGSTLYSVITKTLGIPDPIPNYNFTYNNTHIQLNLTTFDYYNVSLFYTTDYYARTGTTISFTDNASLHTFYIPVNPGTRYYYKLFYKNGTDPQFTKVQSNGMYFSFVIDPPSEKNEALIDLTLDIPQYPAILGTWTLNIYINQENKTNTNVYTPKLGQNALAYSISFTVNTSLEFTFEELLIQKGKFTNTTGTFNKWIHLDQVSSLNQQVLSPGDSIGIIGSLSYKDSGVPINTSDFTYTGFSDLYLEGNKINTNSLPIYELGSNPTTFNLSTISGLNNKTMKFFSVQIPSTDIYGNISVNMSITFPNAISSLNYKQVESYFDLEVKYHLGVRKTTGENSYQLTETNVVGSAEILPYHWYNQPEKYSNENLSNILSIPASSIDVSFTVFRDSNGSQYDIFTGDRVNYTLFWYRQVLDSSLDIGSYTLNLTWNSDNQITRESIVYSSSVYTGNPLPFSYAFSLGVSYKIKELSSGLVVKPGDNVTLRFKIIVEKTGIAWDKDLNPSVSGKSGKIPYNDILSEYRITETAGTTEGPVSYQVSINTPAFSGTIGTISYNISSSQVGESVTTPNTNPVSEKGFSLLDFVLMGLGIGSVAVFVIVLLRFTKPE